MFLLQGADVHLAGIILILRGWRVPTLLRRIVLGAGALWRAAGLRAGLGLRRLLLR